MANLFRILCTLTGRKDQNLISAINVEKLLVFWNTHAKNDRPVSLLSRNGNECTSTWKIYLDLSLGW